MKTPAQVLREAAALVERGHCKEHFAVTKGGDVTWGDYPDAVAWCALGAMDAVCPRDARRNVAGATMEARTALREVVGQPLDDWNDAHERTAAEVAAAMRKAADNLEAVA